MTDVDGLYKDGITTSPPSKVEPSLEATSTSEVPKAIVSFTTNAKKRGKTSPTFTVGELMPWKGVWFKVVYVSKSGIFLQPKMEKLDEQELKTSTT